MLIERIDLKILHVNFVIFVYIPFGVINYEKMHFVIHCIEKKFHSHPEFELVYLQDCLKINHIFII